MDRFDGYLYDHLYVFQNNVHELRNRNCLRELFSTSSDRAHYINEETKGLVALPYNSIEINFQYVNWKFIFEDIENG